MEESLLEIDNSLLDQLIALNNLRKSCVELQEERVKFSARRAELYGDRWQNGDIDILEYVRSQNDLQDSKIQVINYKTAYMDLLDQYNFETARPGSTNAPPVLP